MNRLQLWLITPNAEIVAVGKLITSAPDPLRGSLTGQFSYDTEYLQYHHAFAIDPVALPLGPESFSADRPQAGIHAVFEDALPDDWGRSLLISHHQLTRKQCRPAYLLQYLNHNHIGALLFTTDDTPPALTQTANIITLSDLLNAAEYFENQCLDKKSDLTKLFQAGSSPGGARPKVLISDANNEYIAKFPSAKDRLDMIRLEAATLTLASQAGIHVNDVSIESCGSREVLLVKRFDITSSGGRKHLISLQSLLQADGYYHISYKQVAEIVRQFSHQPNADLMQLYRHMVFNACIGNTDDHLKNFSMLHDEAGWSLSPAYDLMPNVGGNFEHVLSFGFSNGIPSYQDLMKLGSTFQLKKQQHTIFNEVYDTVKQWRNHYSDLGVSENDILALTKDIEFRLGYLNPLKK